LKRLARVPRAAVLAAGIVAGIFGPVVDGAVFAADSQGLYVSTQGDDRRDGSSPAKALRTISAALSRAQPGDTIFVGPGTYSEQLVTKRGGAPGAEITIKGSDGKSVINGSSLGWASAKSQNQALVELRHPYVRVVGLTIENSKNTGILLAADDLTVEDNRIVDTQLHAISTDTSRQTNYHDTNETMIRRIVLKNNLVERASLGGDSQAVSLIADGFLVEGNTVRDSLREGIDIWLGSRRGEVVNNTVSGNAATGIYVDGAAYVKIHHNIVYRNRSGIGVTSEDKDYATHDIWVYDNVVYDNREVGCYLWDDKWRPGVKGVQNVLLAYNTIIGNKHTISVAGENNTGKIVNNLGYSTKSSVENLAAHSSVDMRNNVWLPSLTGFVSAERKDFRLTDRSPALDKGTAIPPLDDKNGGTFSIATDFAGLSRVSGRKPDAGAFEYQGSGSAD